MFRHLFLLALCVAAISAYRDDATTEIPTPRPEHHAESNQYYPHVQQPLVPVHPIGNNVAPQVSVLLVPYQYPVGNFFNQPYGYYGYGQQGCQHHGINPPCYYQGYQGYQGLNNYYPGQNYYYSGQNYYNPGQNYFYPGQIGYQGQNQQYFQQQYSPVNAEVPYFKK